MVEARCRMVRVAMISRSSTSTATHATQRTDDSSIHSRDGYDTIADCLILLSLTMRYDRQSKKRFVTLEHEKAFGDSKAFNAKTLLLLLPKLVLPVVIYYAFALPINESAGYFAIAATGVLGLLFRNKILDIIEDIYKNEKDDTIDAYSEKN